VSGTQTDINFVCGIAEVAKDEIVLGKAGMDEGIEPAIVLHPVGERIAYHANTVAFFEDEQ
jgi:hypothetical protein